MAIGAGMRFEMRQSGSPTNGGGFNGGRGAAQLTLTDLACTAGSTTVTSATGGFTADMVGCALVITVSGTWRPGQYLIATRASANAVTLLHTPCPLVAGTAGSGTVSAGKDYAQSDTGISIGTVTIPSAANTTLTTSSISGITAAMVGNMVYLALAGGAGGTAGWYEIVSVESTTACTLDRATGVSGSNVTGVTSDGSVVRVGGAVYIVNGTTLTLFFSTFTAGNKLWVKAGTYALTTAAVTAGTAGTTSAPIFVEGFNTVRGDSPTGLNRPLIDGGAYQITFAVGWHLRNLRGTSTASTTWYMTNSSYGSAYNCKVTNTNTTAGDGFRAHLCRVTNCEFIAVAGIALASAGGATSNCWMHDSVTGFTLASATVITGCLIENCQIGLSGTATPQHTIDACTWVGCGSAVKMTTTASAWSIRNNIFAHNTVGLNWSGGTNYPDHNLFTNNFFGNGTDVVSVTRGVFDTAYDPAFRGLRSWNDLVLVSHSGTTSCVVTSATGGFTSYLQAGDYIWTDASAGWTSGTWRVVSVDSATQITLAYSGGFPAADGATGGKAKSLRTAVGVSDCRPGVASLVLTAGLGLTLGVG